MEEKKKEGLLIVVPCEVYSRIVGYLRPVQNWNAAKQQEFADRQVFTAMGRKCLRCGTEIGEDGRCPACFERVQE
ncbi:MAG: hypothetical protein JXR84_04235 [Anaerolineae bacterium]|nr:hypothetical protein [Anaerolineae bacterium]